MKLTIVAGARPNFVKIAPLIHEINRLQAQGRQVTYRLVHTGQHYDAALNDVFFEELQIPQPHVNLEVGSGTQAEQVANIMVMFERDLVQHPTDLVVVVGDVNSTMACTIAAKKLNVKVVHIEAGIRSFDMTMPEEINRMVTDAIADYFFTTTPEATANLERTGVPSSRIFLVGNIMIDTLRRNEDRFKRPAFFDDEQLRSGEYLVLTLHRPSNVDDPKYLQYLLDTILANINGHKLVFPVHPRTKKNLRNITIDNPNLKTIDPVGYLEFNYLVKNSKAAITDSGGIQEETTVMRVPCLTLRKNTERPETVSIGSNVLIGDDMDLLKHNLGAIFQNAWKQSNIPALWDGKTSERIMDILLNLEL